MGSQRRQRCLHAFWEMPDFGECRMMALDKLMYNFSLLRRGYQTTTLRSILTESLRLLRPRAAIYPNEGQGIVELLAQLADYDRKRTLQLSLRKNVTAVGSGGPPAPVARKSETELSRGIEDHMYLDIVALLLKHPHSITSESPIDQLLRIVVNYALLVGTALDPNRTLHYDSDAMAVDARQPAYRSTGQQQLIVHYPRRPVRPSHGHDRPWFTDAVHVHWEGVGSATTGGSVRIAVFAYRNLSALLRRRYVAKVEGYYDMEYELNSQIATVGAAIGDAGLQSVDISNSDSELSWIPNACVLTSANNFTVCHCDSVGTYAVLITSYIIPTPEYVIVEFDLVITLGYGICVAFIFLTLILFVLCRRSMSTSLFVLKLQICFSTAASMTIFVAQPNFKTNEPLYPYVISTLTFLVLLPLSTEVCCEMLLYLRLARMQHIKNVLTKLLVLSWGIPIFVTAANLIAQSVEGFKSQRWFLEVTGDNLIYVYSPIVANVILIIMHLILYLAVSAGLRQLELRDRRTDPTVYYDKTKRRFLRRSLVFELVYTAMFITCFVYANRPYCEDCKLASAVLGFVICLTYAIKPQTFCCSDCDGSSDKMKPPKDHKHLNGSPPNVKELLVTKPDIMSNHKGNNLTNHVTSGLHNVLRGSPIKTTLTNHNKIHHHHHHGAKNRKCGANRAETRELEDLIHRQSQPSIISRGGTQETYLSMGGSTSLRLPADYLRTAAKRADYHPMRRPINLDIVDYEGSPHKFKTDDEDDDDDGEFVAQSRSAPVPKPQVGRCFLRLDSNEALGGTTGPRVTFDSSQMYDSDEEPLPSPLPPPKVYLLPTRNNRNEFDTVV